jgi:CDGSH-type Zn-finger protein
MSVGVCMLEAGPRPRRALLSLKVVPAAWKLNWHTQALRQDSQGEADMTEPVIAAKAPIAVDVEAGKTYWWCACGKSAKQPFCDGSHKGSEFTPVKYQAAESKKAWFCACKHSTNQPLCDGSHKKL